MCFPERKIIIQWRFIDSEIKVDKGKGFNDVPTTGSKYLHILVLSYLSPPEKLWLG